MRVIPQPIQLGGDGLDGREFGVGIAFLGDQLAANLRSVQPGVEALGAKLGISLTLTINNRRNVGEEIRQMIFGAFAPARRAVVQADQATIQFMGADANRLAVPPQFAFGAPLPTRSEFFDSPGHEQPSSTAREAMRRLDEQRFE